MTTRLRVIGGALKGKPIEVPPQTRPTLALVRRGVFDYLGRGVVGARVLDLFAGTGALGIEALSRGAERVWFVERSPVALKILRRNLGALGLLEQTRVVPMDVMDLLDGPPPEPFDLVFADPPYGFRAWARLFDLLRAWVTPEGLVVSESSRRDPFPGPEGWEKVWERAYGETCVRIHRRLSRDL